MAIRTPDLQPRSKVHNYWGVYSDAIAGLPNQAGNPLGLPQFSLEAGDDAFNDGAVAGAPGVYVCTSPGVAGAGNAVWVLVGPGSGSLVAKTLQSDPGAFTAPIASVVGDLVRISALSTVAIADQSSGIAAMGVITAKPTPITATVAYAGEVTVVPILTPGFRYFLGIAGAPTATPPDPVVLGGTGTISQLVGIAKDLSTLILSPDVGILL